MMNSTIELLLRRKSVRAYRKREIPPDAKEQILDAVLRSPTAGNLMLYSVIDITHQPLKERLVETCDNQPFIAKAPWVLLFLADYQRWWDFFVACDVAGLSRESDLPVRRPQVGDLMLALDDAIIAAQTAVVAAESLGIGSCYIGDIMEKYETHQALFDLPRYVFPACLVCFGYPSAEQVARHQPARFNKSYIVFENRYKRFDMNEFVRMFESRKTGDEQQRSDIDSTRDISRSVFRQKFSAPFALEMNRSVERILQNWANSEVDADRGNPQ